MDFDPDAPALGGRLFGLPFTPAEARLVVIPVPWEVTTSYRRGTRGAPAAVLAASAQVDLEDLQFGDAWRAGIALAEEDAMVSEWDRAAEPDALAVIEAGGGLPDAAARVDAFGARLNALVEREVEAVFARGAVPAVLGGDHSVPFGAYVAAARRHPGLGILHVDAHADLRVAYEGFTWSHASIFHNALGLDLGRLVQVGVRDCGAAELAAIRGSGGRIRSFTDLELAEAEAEGRPWARVVEDIVAALPDPVWVSVDIDGLDPSLCPGTGTPVPGGLSFRQLALLLAAVARTRRIVGFDLVEVGTGEWDAIVGARVLYKLCAATLRSRA